MFKFEEDLSQSLLDMYNFVPKPLPALSMLYICFVHEKIELSLFLRGTLKKAGFGKEAVSLDYPLYIYPSPSFQVDVDYTEKDIAISGYPLSAALTCAKLCTGFEEAWGIH